MVRFAQTTYTNNLHKQPPQKTTPTNNPIKDNSHKQPQQKTIPTKKGRGRPGEPTVPRNTWIYRYKLCDVVMYFNTIPSICVNLCFSSI
jgi:hypothetical protein